MNKLVPRPRRGSAGLECLGVRQRGQYRRRGGRTRSGSRTLRRPAGADRRHANTDSDARHPYAVCGERFASFRPDEPGDCLHRDDRRRNSITRLRNSMPSRSSAPRRARSPSRPRWAIRRSHSPPMPLRSTQAICRSLVQQVTNIYVYGSAQQTALLYGTYGVNDTVVDTSTYAEMEGTGYSEFAVGFGTTYGYPSVYGYAALGQGVAYTYAGAGDTSAPKAVSRTSTPAAISTKLSASSTHLPFPLPAVPRPGCTLYRAGAARSTPATRTAIFRTFRRISFFNEVSGFSVRRRGQHGHQRLCLSRRLLRRRDVQRQRHRQFARRRGFQFPSHRFRQHRGDRHRQRPGHGLRRHARRVAPAANSATHLQSRQLTLVRSTGTTAQFVRRSHRPLRDLRRERRRHLLREPR